MLNKDVTKLIETNFANHLEFINKVRSAILNSNKNLVENIKWNGPNYTFNNADRITTRIMPKGSVQIIFHRGAKIIEQPKARLIEDKDENLIWKANDRAILEVKDIDDLKDKTKLLTKIVNDWIKAIK